MQPEHEWTTVLTCWGSVFSTYMLLCAQQPEPSGGLKEACYPWRWSFIVDVKIGIGAALRRYKSNYEQNRITQWKTKSSVCHINVRDTEGRTCSACTHVTSPHKQHLILINLFLLDLDPAPWHGDGIVEITVRSGGCCPRRVLLSCVFPLVIVVRWLLSLGVHSAPFCDMSFIWQTGPSCIFQTGIRVLHAGTGTLKG